MKVTKEHARSFLFILGEMLIGALLLFRPVGFTSTIIMGAGVLLMIRGVMSIIHYFKSTTKEAAKEQSLTLGLLMLLAGWFCAFRSDWFIVTFPAMTILYGVGMLTASMGKIQMMADMLREKNKKWFLFAISAAVSAICAAIIICNPFTATAALWMFSGISLIVEAILDTVSLLCGGADHQA